MNLKKAFLQFGMPLFDMTEDNFLSHPNWDVFTFGTPPVAHKQTLYCHMKQKLLFFTFILSVNVYSQKGNCNFPFPNHTQYHQGVILPKVNPTLMADRVRSFFKQWEKTYVRYKTYGGEECAYIFSKKDSIHHKEKEDHDCVSEGIGYGMIIFVEMADTNNSKHNQTLFDKLFSFYKHHPGTRGNEKNKSKDASILMAFSIDNIKSDAEVIDKTAASDGDIDIAFSLLLADAQWSSNGDINYLFEADTIIKAIFHEDINRYTKMILTSNNNEDDNDIKTAKDHKYYDIRTSDFIPSELKAFNKVFKGDYFRSVVDSSYKNYFIIQTLSKVNTGLVPDFMKNIGDTIQKAGYIISKPHGFYQESIHDGDYNYNACRVPWRIATDYIISGDTNARNFVRPINSWIMSKCDTIPGKINAGYELNGTDILKKNRIFAKKEKDTLMMSFVCPFAVSAMVDEHNQTWLNNLWDCIIKLPFTSKVKDLEYGYYENTIKMLNLIIISGNYWSN